MSLSLYSKTSTGSKIISSEISQSNILNYKRRSRLISGNYCHNTNKTVINSIDTLKNFYNTLFDFKNIISDNIQMAKKENRLFTKKEEVYLKSLIDKTKCEIVSAYNIYCKNVDIKRLNRDEKKLVKKIDDIGSVLYLLYQDAELYYKL